MQATQLLASKRLTAPVLSSSCRSRPVLSPRTYATTSTFSSSRARIHVSKQESTRITLQTASLARSYWWSSKPVVQASVQDGDVVAALSSIEEPPKGIPPVDSIQGDITEQSGSVPIDAASIPVTEISSSADALSSLEALQAATTEFSALATLDYSHLFSWGWPAGVFIRLFSYLQEFPLLATSPIACMVLGVLILRAPLTYFQLKGLKATAAWAPYQDQFKTLGEEYNAAMKSGNNIVAMEKAQQIMQIREKAKFSPFAGLAPAVGLGYVGIGSFLGMGKLAAYHKEVVEMGGAGPLANVDGFLGSGWLTDLSVFNPGLLVLFTGLTWLNVRRSALDSAKYSPWLARMPMLLTPVFGVMSLLLRFSSAQMIVGAASIGYTVMQSYLLRVPTIRYYAGMQGVPNQDPKVFKFPGFLESWREAKKGFIEWQDDMVAKRTMGQAGSIPSAASRPVSRDTLKIKDAPPPPRILSNPYPTSPPAPPPPMSIPTQTKVTAKAKDPQFVLPPTLAKKQTNAKRKK